MNITSGYQQGNYMQYLFDIDGQRALAILATLVFNFDGTSGMAAHQNELQYGAY